MVATRYLWVRPWVQGGIPTQYLGDIFSRRRPAPLHVHLLPGALLGHAAVLCGVSGGSVRTLLQGECRGFHTQAARRQNFDVAIADVKNGLCRFFFDAVKLDVTVKICLC